MTAGRFPEIGLTTSGNGLVLTGFGRPFGLAADGERRLHIADMDLHAVARLSRNLKTVEWLAGDDSGWSAPQLVMRGTCPISKRNSPGRFNGPHSVSIGADGEMWVVTYYQPVIHRLHSDGVPTAAVTEIAGQPLVGPATGRLDRASRLWIAEYGHHGVSVINADGVLIGSLGGGAVEGFSRGVAFRSGHGAGAFDRPHMATELEDGMVVVADTWNHRLQRFDASGHWYGCLGGGIKCWRDDGRSFAPGMAPGAFHAPVAIGTGKDGRFVVTDWGNNRLQWFDIDGNLIAIEDTHGLDRPYDAQVIDDMLVVADSHNARVLMLRTF